MNEPKFLPDDPKLTAYALGELDAADTAAMEIALRTAPAARAVVAEIRLAAQRLEAALHAEAAEPLVSEPLAPAASGREPAALVVGRAPKPAWGRVVRFPRFSSALIGAAAAAFALVALLRHPVAPEAAQVEAMHGELTAERRAKAIIEARNEALNERLAAYEAQYGSDAANSAAVPGGSVASAPPMTTAAIGTARAAAAPLATGVAALHFPLLSQPTGIPIAPSTEPSWFGLRATIPATASAAGNALNTLVSGSDSADATSTQIAGLEAPRNLPDAAPSLPAFNPPDRGELFVRPDSFVARGLDDVAPAASGSKAGRENEFLGVWQNPYSTYSVNVDTANYAVVRGFLQAGKLPPVDAVRIEELLNYFPYRYPGPATDGERGADSAPFAASLEVSEAPWAPSHRLVRIGLKGREVSSNARPPANLVFLLDVSGSMTAQGRLPLLKRSLRLLLGKLRAEDRVAIVTYAGRSGLALPSTPVANVTEILAALESLSPRRSNNVGMGIQLAYDIASANFITGGINRVVLCTDGDFNLGPGSDAELMHLVEEKARTGTFLTALGFGMGRFRDATLEKLADKGQGHYGYIDSQREADYILGEQVNGTVMTIARDVKIQVQFNPRKVASYRLIGFEDRMPAKKYFKNDRLDAGDVGVGHTLTALYEIVPADEDDYADLVSEVDDLKYQERPVKAKKTNLKPSVEAQLLTVFLRYKEPSSEENRLLEFELTDTGAHFTSASADFKFAAAVAQFGMQLRKSPHKGAATMENIINWATPGADSLSDDPGGLRREFIDLARRAETLMQ